ncbi:hypothetical protein [Butyrivibrio sp.]|uniref:hypothetical protein n=1 Tax=Butyrivibrio sp. TaxID=28121 RepID=UPI0025C3405A|nr:hypothetical protein [Butyrivibrio sp.]MBQ7428341.1 hypothetical protein [Butyrivibrio sp.]MBQ9303645.1 hypothetical protein [Butyrivibrio sp.]
MRNTRRLERYKGDIISKTLTFEEYLQDISIVFAFNPIAGLSMYMIAANMCADREYNNDKYPELKGVGRVGKRMEKWYDEYIAPQYCVQAEELGKPSLTAEQFYLLRCNLIHTGEVTVHDIKHPNQPTPNIKLYFVDSPTAGRTEGVTCRGNDYEHPIEIGVDVNTLCEYLNSAMQRYCDKSNPAIYIDSIMQDIEYNFADPIHWHNRGVQ